MVRIETSPEDLAGMAVAEGILTARGGMTSHAQWLLVVWVSAVCLVQVLEHRLTRRVQWKWMVYC